MILPKSELIPLIHMALKRGQRVRLITTGMSMLPFIVSGDSVEIEPKHTLHLGDIVLAECTLGRYVLHRIVCIRGDNIWLRGDNQTLSIGPISKNKVLGRAITIFRNGHRFSLDNEIRRFAGLFWVMIIPLGFFLVQFMLLVQYPQHITWWIKQEPRRFKYWWLQLISKNIG